jgi:hypothetical protein
MVGPRKIGPIAGAVKARRRFGHHSSNETRRGCTHVDRLIGEPLGEHLHTRALFSTSLADELKETGRNLVAQLNSVRLRSHGGLLVWGSPLHPIDRASTVAIH